MTSFPLVSYDIGVPDMVMAPPGKIVWPSMMKSEEALAVGVELSNVSTDIAVMLFCPRSSVLLPITPDKRPDGGKIRVWETVMIAPGVKI